MNKIGLPQSTPEAQGISSAAILAFVKAVDATIHEFHSFMLLRHGQVVAAGWWSPYRATLPHMLFSLSKSFASSAIGLAVAEGLLSIDDTVLSFFPKDAPKQVSENLAAMRVRHLLSMSTGHHEDSTGRLQKRYRKNWVKGFLALPVEHLPGTHWVYNSGATYMLSAIIQKVTGMKLLDYLRPRLLEPLGIEDAAWETSPQGINMGGWGLSVKTEDIARFGQLYLQKGSWDGKRILPEAWVEEATSSQIANDRPDSDWHQGYGYQFWRCRHGAYRGDGAFGQYCIVMPEQDAVLAITSGVGDMQAPLDLVWEHLLPAMVPGRLPANQPAYAELEAALAGLELSPVQGQPTAAVASQVSGKCYHFDANPAKIERVTLDFSGAGGYAVIKDAAGEHQVFCGQGEWLEGHGLFNNSIPAVVAASAAWTGVDTYEMALRFIETPFFQTYTCKFSANQVTIDSKLNVSFGPTQMPALEGHF